MLSQGHMGAPLYHYTGLTAGENSDGGRLLTLAAEAMSGVFSGGVTMVIYCSLYVGLCDIEWILRLNLFDKHLQNQRNYLDKDNLNISTAPNISPRRLYPRPSDSFH